jgi:6-phosphogluconate dehydrogenase (decarboxylating)
MSPDELASRVKSLEARIKELEHSCCGVEAIKERVENNLLLKKLIEEVTKLEAKINTLYKVWFMVIGGSIVISILVQLLGVPHKLINLLGG